MAEQGLSQNHSEDIEDTTPPTPDNDIADRPHACQKCTYRAKTRANLREHNKYTHLGTRCVWEGCDVETEDEISLRQHIRREHVRHTAVNILDQNGEVKIRFACSWPGCGNNFASSEGALRCSFYHVSDEVRARDNETDAEWCLVFDYDEEEHDRPNRVLPPLRPTPT